MTLAPERDGGLAPARDLRAGGAGVPSIDDPRAAQATDPDTARVTAILVCHDGESWLPRALRALAASRRRPERVVAVDVGSRDGTRALLEAAVQRGEIDEVVQTARRSGFGASVTAAVRSAAPAAGRSSWLWLLHDDCAPDAAALRELLAAARVDPSIGVLGPKLVGGRDGRGLLEVGVSISASGRRETGLDPGEIDQGQRDGLHDVLAVNTAGMLVRADVWAELKGLEPSLPLFRDDVDLGWRARSAGHRVVCVTGAVVRHTEAASRGLRPLAAVRGRALRADRSAGVRALLLNSAVWLLPLLLLRLVAATVGRALGLLLAGAPRAALVQVLALVSAFARPDLLVAGRWRRWRTRRARHSEVRPYLARPGTSVRLLRDAAGAVFAPAMQKGRPHSPLRPLLEPLALVLVLSAAAVWPVRDLIGRGRLTGGAVSFAPPGAADLWRSLVGSWQPSGLGAAAAGPAWLAPMTLLSVLTGGRPSVALDLLLLGCTPLAGLSAYLCLRRAVASRALRAWAAAAYALLPAATGATGGGRLGTAVVLVLLPVFAALIVATVRVGARWRVQATAGAALVLAVMSSVAPVIWVLAAGSALPVLLAARRRLRAVPACLLRLGLVLAAPALLLLPDTRDVLRHPARLAAEAGWAAPGLSDPRLDPWDVLLLHPGGPGAYALAVSAPLLAAALAALLLGGRRAPVIRASWAVAVLALAAAWAVAGVRLDSPDATRLVVAWPGAALAVAGAAVLLAAALGAEGAHERLRGTSFGWRQLGAGVLAVVAAAVPVVVAVAVSGLSVPGLSTRPSAVGRTGTALPAFVASDLSAADHPRALLLSGTSAQVRWSLDRGNGATLGSETLEPPAAALAALDAAVSDVVSGRGGSAASRLPVFGVRYLVLRSPLDPGLVRALDGTPGLLRTGRQQPDAVWEVAADRTGGVAARVRITDARGTLLGRLPSSGVDVAARVPAGGAGRLLVLAEPRDSGWRASVDGVRLEPVPAPASAAWAQAFRLPAGAGHLSVTHEDPQLHREQSGRLMLLGVLLLLLVPVRVRRILGRSAATSAATAGPTS